MQTALPWLWSNHDVVLHHFRRYTKTQLQELIVRGSFDLQRLSYYTTALLPFLALQRIWQRRNQNRAPVQYEVNVPHPVVNRLLTGIMTAERALLRGLNMPMGSSLIAVSRAGSTPQSRVVGQV